MSVGPSIRFATRSTTVACFVLGAAACGEEQLCDICGLNARVVGTVTASGRGGVANALVRMRPLYGAACCGTSEVDDTVRAVTDRFGTFEGTVVGESIAGPDRIEVRITPLPEDGLGPLVDTIDATFAAPWETTPTVYPEFELLLLGASARERPASPRRKTAVRIPVA